MTATETTPNEPLNARLSELVQEAGKIRDEFEAYVNSVPTALYNERADANSWSVAENIEHLCMIEDSIGRLLTSMSKQLRAENANESSSTSLLGSLDDFDVAGVKTKLIAPAPYRPTGTLSVEDGMARIRQIRSRVLEAVQKANGLDLTKAKFPHPYFGALDGYQWLLLIALHEKRHLNQMKQTVQKLVTGSR